MDQEELLSRLNWFYSLELTQVDNYLAQSRAVDDPYVATGLERVASMEKGHADKISDLVIGSGGQPTRVGDVLSPILGAALGKFLGATDVATMLKTNIKIEAKAVTDYQKLIRELESDGYDPALLKSLQQNLVDEDLHSSWFAQVINGLPDRSWPLSPVLAQGDWPEPPLK
ncbi:MAG: ferritin-like domain-containing protein [Firmicutes bacterium]|nr:ferritin-like domain-containing protein [Bacillota bacterium]MCL5040697.1 ferritin-like domain-containing protein [Bacillota bacterium]